MIPKEFTFEANINGKYVRITTTPQDIVKEYLHGELLTLEIHNNLDLDTISKIIDARNNFADMNYSDVVENKIIMKRYDKNGEFYRIEREAKHIEYLHSEKRRNEK